MCDQTMPYTPGTIVWVKLGEIKSVWWPGKVVDISDAPEETQKYANKRRNYKAIIHFESDNYYEVVFSMDKVCLYSNTKKNEFLEKGYLKFLKQQKTKQITGCDMSNFLSDVVKIEAEIGGDVDIFKQFDVQSEVVDVPAPVNIKELFISTKDAAKKKKKEEINRSTFRPLVTRQNTPRVLIPRSVSMPCTQVSYAQLPNNYICQMKAGCTFSTYKYDLLKRHMNTHKNENDNETVGSTPPITSRSVPISKAPRTKAFSPPIKRRKFTKKITNNQKPKTDKKKPIKKIKLQDELLKDWSDDQDDIVVQDASTSQGESIFSKNAEVSQSTYSRNDFGDTSEDSVDEEYIRTCSNDFKAAIYDDAQSSSKTIQVSDGCELPDDMDNSCSLITETDNTLNQISNLEESLKVTSCTPTKNDENIVIDKSSFNSLNESDSNMLTKDDEHISVVDNPSNSVNDSETNFFTKDDENTSVDNISSNYPNKSTSPSKGIINEVDNSKNLDEITISKESSVENGEIIEKEHIIDGNIKTNIISNNVNSDSETIVMNTDSDDSSHLSDANMTDGDMISKLPKPDWVKEEGSWATDANNYLKKAKRFTTLRGPKINRSQMVPSFENSHESFRPKISTPDYTPPIFSEIAPNETALLKPEVRVQVRTVNRVYAEQSKEVFTDEELLKNPDFLKAIEDMKSGNAKEGFLEVVGVHIDDMPQIERKKVGAASPNNQKQS